MAKSEGKILQELREEFGISKVQFAKRLGVNRSTIYNWEGGLKKSGIGLDNWIKIGEKLRIDIFEHVPHLKKYRKEEKLYPEHPDIFQKVSDIEELYLSQKKEVDLLKQQMSDYPEMVRTLQATLKEKEQRIKELEEKLSKYEKN